MANECATYVDWKAFFLQKSEAYAWEDDDFSGAGLSDWNESYFLGETTVRVEGVVRVELDVEGDEVRPLTLEIVELEVSENL